MFFWIILLIIYLPTKLLFPTIVKGRKNLPKGKAIYAPNHQSNVDICIIACSIFKKMYALGKAELFKNKFVGSFLKNIGCIKVYRGKPDIDAVKKVFYVLKKKNKPLVVFPTGTRKSSPDELKEIKNGVAMFSVKTQSPIIPMVLIKRPKLFRLNKLVIGKPLDLTKYDGRPATKELYEEISNDLENAMQNLLKENMKKWWKQCLQQCYP